MARIPEQQITQLKQTADLVAVIKDRGVKLRKTGHLYKGRCPFHEEKTPSFTVTPAENLWHCFGCDTGGDVIRFVELMDKVSFPEAFKRLSDDQSNNKPTASKKVSSLTACNGQVFLEYPPTQVRQSALQPVQRAARSSVRLLSASPKR